MADTIGQINGKWQFLFKLQLIITPLLFSATLGWGTWVTNSLYDQKYEIRITQLRLDDSSEKCKDIDKKLDTLTTNQVKILIKLGVSSQELAP